jgi:lipase chaperone LimK
VRDIEINERRIYDPKFKDYLKKKVKIVKREGLNSSLDGRPRGVLGNVVR